MAERYVEGHWYCREDMMDFCHIPAGYYDIDANRRDVPTDVVIPYHLVPSLMEAAMEKGCLPAKVQSRVEDLKITHRLLDLLEKKG